MMANGVYTPPTATMHVLQKDSAIIAEFARALGVDTPMLDAAAPLYDEAEAQGYRRRGCRRRSRRARPPRRTDLVPKPTISPFRGPRVAREPGTQEHGPS